VKIDTDYFKGTKYREEIAQDSIDGAPNNLLTFIEIFYTACHRQLEVPQDDKWFWDYYPLEVCTAEHFKERGYTDEYSFSKGTLEMCTPLKKNIPNLTDDMDYKRALFGSLDGINYYETTRMYITACNNATAKPGIVCKSNEQIKEFLDEIHLVVNDWEEKPVFSNDANAPLTEFKWKRAT